MENWKPLLEQAVAKAYPGVTTEWDGNVPVLIIPDELKDRSRQITDYATALWTSWGSEPESGQELSNRFQILPQTPPAVSMETLQVLDRAWKTARRA